jgi:MSHA pilin protein MshD
MFIERRQSGVTLVELVVFIVIVSVAVVGVLAVINQAVRSSADPVRPKQALAIAEALMEEIQLMPFTYCDPDDPGAATATAPSAAGGCTTVEAMGPEAGETRSGATPFDNVNDYHGYPMAGIVDVTGAVVPGLAGYSAAVTVAPTALGPAASPITVASADALLITVTVTDPAGATYVLEGYRTRYAPNSLP